MQKANGVPNGVASGALVAAGEVRDALPAPDFADLSLETQTHAVGLIHPPPDIRAIVDKTAQFVAKNGAEFEKRIISSEKDNPKFNFLKSTDPYNAYYKYRVDEFKKGDGEAPAAGAAPTAAQAAQAAAAAVPAVAPTSVLKPAEPLVAPDEALYTVHVPEGLRLQDLDLVKLTAQFVSRNGKQFLTDLAMKETRNADFNFLKPTHSMFTFFTSLVDAYSRVLMPPAGTQDKLRADTADRQKILERCLRRLEWDKVQSAEAKAAADAAERERLAMQSIDWHDFVVVETIDFYEDEEAELPLPMTLKDVQALNKAAPFEEEEEAAEAEAGGAEVEMEMDDEEKQLVADAGAAEDGAAAPPPNSAPDAAPPVPGGGAMRDADDDDDMLVVKDYQRPDPRAQRLGAPQGGMVVSPITGEMIPVDQMAEHMRISLIDPRWKTQREAMLSKIRDTTKASDDEISRNLVGLARSRPDMFGSTQEEVSQMVAESVREAQKSGNDRPVAWDGSARGEGLRNLKAAIQDQQADQAARAPPQTASLPPPPRPGPAAMGASALPPPPIASRPPPPVQLPPPPRPAASAVPQPVALPPPPRPAQAPPPMRPPPMQLPRPPMGMAPPGMAPPGMAFPPPPRPPSGPAPPPGAPPPMPEAPPAKRQRTDFVLQPEDEFLAEHPGPAKVRVAAPDLEGNEQLNGQILEVEVASLVDNIGAFKARLAEVLGLQANRLQLSREGVGFLRDQHSLAFNNVSADMQLKLSVRERGGRKK